MGKQFKKIIFLFLLIAVSFSAGFAANDFLGSYLDKIHIKGLKNISEESGAKIEDKNNLGAFWSAILDNKNDKKIEEKVDFGIFWETWKLVEDKYKLEPLDYQKMVYGAISGMVNSLNDPYTVFLSPEDNKMFEQDMEGSFSGIGAEIGFRDKMLTIIAPLKDSPAEKAGVLAGDIILKIDGKEIMKMSLDEAVRLIRGEKGTKVKLTISRNGLEKLKEIEITRDIIVINTVEWEMKDNKIAYIRINQFKADTAAELDDKIDEMLLSESRGIILDLRNNPGGYLDVAIDVASRFMDKDKVVVVEDYGGKQNIHKTDGPKRFDNIPIIVLVNEGSASASEILAGAFRDNFGSKLVGKKTFGKGLVQEMERLKDGSALKITVAKWLTPNGTNINKNGIEPDFEVDMTEQDYKEKRDPQLEKALEILKISNF